jgi:SAM-dependent methyltransferase
MLMEHIWHNEQFGEHWFDAQEIYRQMVEHCRPDGKLVEVGCWKGRSTAFLLVEAFNKSPKIEVYAVDTWAGSPEHAGHASIVDGSLYEEFSRNISPVSRQLIALRIASPKAAEFFEDQSLDGVFIDAAHEYDAVSADIVAWKTKLIQGGILAGHDYSSAWPGVISAVDALCPGRKIVGQSWMVAC